MDKEVVQKEFQGHSFRFLLPVGLIALTIAAFCFWRHGFVLEMHKRLDPKLFDETPVRMQATSIPGCTGTGLRSKSVNRRIKRSDFYLVARHNLAEGTVLRLQDLEVVRMPGLRGYNLAFSSPQAVIGMSTAHAVPEGQPVLPYHVEESLKPHKYNTSGR